MWTCGRRQSAQSCSTAPGCSACIPFPIHSSRQRCFKLWVVARNVLSDYFSQSNYAPNIHVNPAQKPLLGRLRVSPGPWWSGLHGQCPPCFPWTSRLPHPWSLGGFAVLSGTLQKILSVFSVFDLEVDFHLFPFPCHPWNSTHSVLPCLGRWLLAHPGGPLLVLSPGLGPGHLPPVSLPPAPPGT